MPPTVRNQMLGRLRDNIKGKSNDELKEQAVLNDWPFYIGEQVFKNQNLIQELTKGREYRVVCHVEPDQYFTLDQDGKPHITNFNSMRAYAGLPKKT